MVHALIDKDIDLRKCFVIIRPQQDQFKFFFEIFPEIYKFYKCMHHQSKKSISACTISLKNHLVHAPLAGKSLILCNLVEKNFWCMHHNPKVKKKKKCNLSQKKSKIDTFSDNGACSKIFFKVVAVHNVHAPLS